MTLWRSTCCTWCTGRLFFAELQASKSWRKVVTVITQRCAKSHIFVGTISGARKRCVLWKKCGWLLKSQAYNFDRKDDSGSAVPVLVPRKQLETKIEAVRRTQFWGRLFYKIVSLAVTSKVICAFFTTRSLSCRKKWSGGRPLIHLRYKASLCADFLSKFVLFHAPSTNWLRLCNLFCLWPCAARSIPSQSCG